MLENQLVNGQGEPIECVETGEQVTVCVKAVAHEPIPRLNLGYLIKDQLGQPIYGSNQDHSGTAVHDQQTSDITAFGVSFRATLGSGTYSVALTRSETHLGNNYEWRDLALMFTLVNTTKPVFAGSTWLDVAVSVGH